MKRIIVWCAVWAVCACTGPATLRQPAATIDPEGAFATQFIAIQGAGGPAEFRRFCAGVAVDPDQTAEAAEDFCAGYLYRLKLRYGPSRLVMTQHRASGDVYWLEGIESHAVWGVRFPVLASDTTRFEGAMIYQGMYPEGYPETPRISLTDAALDSYFAAMSRADLFSGVVLVARGDDIILQRAYGMADRTVARPSTLETPFRIASVGKMFTAMAVLSLVEAGRLDLDAPFGRYLPDYPSLVASQVTLRQLLTHTSGIEIDDYAPFAEAVAQASNLDEIIAAQIRYIEHMNDGRYANFRPLGSFDYSNEEYDLLGAIVQRVSGQPWDAAVRDLVLRPAHADNVEFLPPANAAAGYSARTDAGWGVELRDSTSLLRPISRPAGSQYTTAADLLRFMRYVERQRQASHLIQTATSAQVAIDDQSGVQTGYGLGFEVERQPCFGSYGHTGSEAGVSAVARFYSQENVTIIILSNRDGMAIDGVTYLERALFGCANSSQSGQERR